MSDHSRLSFDPYEEMHAFYASDNPSEEQQFRFVEAMKYLIDTAVFDSDVIAFSYNLAMYYRDIEEFELEKKYLEIGAKYEDSSFVSFFYEELGFIWYYGLGGEQSYEQAYRYFKDGEERRSRYMMAEMYQYGHYVEQDREKSRGILEDLFAGVEEEKNESYFALSTLFPEIALRLARLNVEEGRDTMDDLDRLLDARDILTVRQARRPSWWNLKTMRDILETTVTMCGNDYDFVDLYDLMTFDSYDSKVTFSYGSTQYSLKIFRNEGETVYEFGDRWYHGADDFLKKAKIDDKRITTVMDQIGNIRIAR